MELVFDHPYYLVLLLSLPLLYFSHFYFMKHVRRKAMKFANFEAMKRVTGSRMITKNIWQLVLRMFVLFLFIMSSAGPVLWYKGDENYNDFSLAIDTSASMLAEDLSPDRFRAAKSAAAKFIDNLDSSTNVAVISFSGVSLVKLILSADLGKVKSEIDSLEITPAGGTDIGSAIITGVNVLLSGRKAKAIILLTDGSQTTGVFVEDSIDAGIFYAKENHVIVHTIGIGTDAGKVGYLPMDLGAAYDRDTLQKIADETGGKFYEARDSEELEIAFAEIATIKNEGYLSIDFRFGLVLIGLVLLFLEWGMVNTKYRAVP
ncbi:MAG: VWA domain-containing protein [Nanoarchaeota archaeon]|nr:VWA domain-containing protein [Nanoarchaeota archaeon]